MNNQKLIIKTVIITLMISFIIFLIGGYYFGKKQNIIKINFKIKPSPTPTITPTPKFNNLTSKWKTYRSKSKKLSFKIPQQLVVLEDKNSIEIYLNEKLLKKSRNCEKQPTSSEVLPCFPYLVSIYYNKIPLKKEFQDEYDKKDLDSINAGINFHKDFFTFFGQNYIWKVNKPKGLYDRPGIEAFTFDKNQSDVIHYFILESYILPYWQFINNIPEISNIDLWNESWKIAYEEVKWDEMATKLLYPIVYSIKLDP